MFGLSMTTAQLQSQSNTLFMLTGINLLPVVVFRVFDGGCFSGDLPISIPDYLHISGVLNLSWCSATISMEPFHFFIMFLLLHLYNLLFRWCACHAARFFFQVNPLLDSEAKPVYAFKDAVYQILKRRC
ncbi:unnamed protein product [Lactuca virosa]|uniref:Uncharacterized protein n=1 Tax=Lactuca virosa TaxID=75947 RepID=A0AAU9LFF3_9ASTR|nr:unnamed protein product [Lactuca virosa]